MRYMHASNLYYAIGDRTLIDVKELSIHQNDRIGLVGKNGQGKTLLLQYLLGKTGEKPHVTWQGKTAVFDQLHTDMNDDNWAQLSGGEKTLKKLDTLFSQHADLLLLDEPTNNLDWTRIEELEKKLLSFTGAYLVVSHDRKLLDNVCNTIWELDEGTISIYKGNYSDYESAKRIEKQHEEQAYEKYTKEKKRLMERLQKKEQQAKRMTKPPSRMGNSEWQLHKGKAKGQQQKIQRVSKVIQERLNRLEVVDKPFEWDNMKMESAYIKPLRAKQVLTTVPLSFSVNHTVIYETEKLSLNTGSKTALIGENGSGKTTLLKQLLSTPEEVTISQQASIGYFDQIVEKLPEQRTILEYVQKGSPLLEHDIRILLGRLRFYRDDVHKRIGVLSGGERVKVALAKLLTGDYNVLILDEPTNHLDIEVIKALESLIQEYAGTVLFVSHDREFVERTATHLWFIENQTVSMFNGSLTEWRTRKQTAQAPDQEAYDLLTLENKLTELISRLSLPDANTDTTQLEQDYQETLQKIRQLKQN